MGYPEYVKELDVCYDTALKWIRDMLIQDEMRLKDVPRKIRASDCTIYMTAFRISRGSCRRYIKDLKILCDDISRLDNTHRRRAEMLRALDDYLWLGHDFKGEKEFGDFLQDIPEHLLQEMCDRGEAVRHHIRAQLKKQGYLEGE